MLESIFLSASQWIFYINLPISKSAMPAANPLHRELSNVSAMILSLSADLIS